MNKLTSFFDLLRKGGIVANPELWKHGGAALQSALAALIVSLVSTGKAFGYELPVTPEVAGSIAGGVAALVGVFVTYVTSDKVGILPAKPAPAADPEGDLRSGA